MPIIATHSYYYIMISYLFYDWYVWMMYYNEGQTFDPHPHCQWKPRTTTKLVTGHSGSLVNPPGWGWGSKVCPSYNMIKGGLSIHNWYDCMMYYYNFTIDVWSWIEYIYIYIIWYMIIYMILWYTWCNTMIYYDMIKGGPGYGRLTEVGRLRSDYYRVTLSIPYS